MKTSEKKYSLEDIIVIIIVLVVLTICIIGISGVSKDYINNKVENASNYSYIQGTYGVINRINVLGNDGIYRINEIPILYGGNNVTGEWIGIKDLCYNLFGSGVKE